MRSASAAAVFALAATAASAQSPAGGEFRVNTYTTSSQRLPDVAAEKDGDFVVSWASFAFTQIAFSDVVARRFDARGLPRGAEFLVNTYTTGHQVEPSVDAASSGRFVVAWTSDQQDGSDLGIFAQRFERDGRRAGGEFQVNTITGGRQHFPSVAVSDGGPFVVAWVGPEASGERVWARRFDGAGTPAGPELAINPQQRFPRHARVAARRAGGFVVVWDEYRAGIGSDIFAQRLDAAGAPAGAAIQVNTYTTRDQQSAAVDVAEDGSFVVAWDSYGNDGSQWSVSARAFDAAGGGLGPQFQVNTYTLLTQARSAVTVRADGAFTVTWDSPQDGSSEGVVARSYSPAAVPLTAEFLVNTYTTTGQRDPRVASDPQGNLVFAWEDAFQDGSSSGVFGRRYGGAQPARMTVDAAALPTSDGNGVLEACEEVPVRPGWRNTSGGTLVLGGTITSLAGPPGATYTIVDGIGQYGSVPDAATADCTDCYVMGVSCPSPRPAVHWDARMMEALQPAVLGVAAPWPLHVGESFTDVPRASSFYRFIETLLHTGVTAGCTGTQYCPAGLTTREQMAAFVLAAREATGYLPPACGAPLFPDVPAASPFCRWVEELARRGVVAGCGGGNYCPQQAVTREQMAVFVLRALDPALNPPACVTPVFNDVPATSAFCRWIEELARRGVVTGCGNGNYCPADPVTREQMAVFLVVTFGLTLYGP